MKRLIFAIYILFCLCLPCFSQADYNINLDYKQINALAAKQSLIPIRSGISGLTPFWNKYSKQFTYAPAFDVAPIKGNVKYKFVATTDDSTKYTFIASKPYSSLAPVWAKIPVGYVNLKITALNASGKEMAEIKSLRFYRAATFHAPYQKPVTSYKESARRAIKYLFDKPYMQSWIEKAIPDTAAYHLYCYPSKMFSAVTELMLNYAKLSPTDHDNAMKIATNAADYLIKISEPADAPLAYFPPTYAGDGDNINNAAKRFRNQFMIFYPAHSANIYLDLYDATKDERYKNAAIRIASTYQKIQETSGTWKLKIQSDGKPVTEVDCIPIEIIQFLDRLSEQYGVKEYVTVRNKAYKWLWKNPMVTFNWSGQFEDVAPVAPYQDLSKDEATAVATYLFNHQKENPSFIQKADELLRYCEDQFVIWEKPIPLDKHRWPTPCVLEQYFCYTPIDASVANLIGTYLNGYRATKNNLYLAKAIELANSVTATQDANSGRYATFWTEGEKDANPDIIDWLNCTSHIARMMLAMDKLMNEISTK